MSDAIFENLLRYAWMRESQGQRDREIAARLQQGMMESQVKAQSQGLKTQQEGDTKIQQERIKGRAGVLKSLVGEAPEQAAKLEYLDETGDAPPMAPEISAILDSLNNEHQKIAGKLNQVRSDYTATAREMDEIKPALEAFTNEKRGALNTLDAEHTGASNAVKEATLIADLAERRRQAIANPEKGFQTSPEDKALLERLRDNDLASVQEPGEKQVLKTRWDRLISGPRPKSNLRTGEQDTAFLDQFVTTARRNLGDAQAQLQAIDNEMLDTQNDIEAADPLNIASPKSLYANQLEQRRQRLEHQQGVEKILLRKLGDVKRQRDSILEPEAARKALFAKRKERIEGAISEVGASVEAKRKRDAIKPLAALASKFGLGEYAARMTTGEFDPTDEAQVAKFKQDIGAASKSREEFRQAMAGLNLALAQTVLKGRKTTRETAPVEASIESRAEDYRASLRELSDAKRDVPRANTAAQRRAAALKVEKAEAKVTATKAALDAARQQRAEIISGKAPAAAPAAAPATAPATAPTGGGGFGILKKE